MKNLLLIACYLVLTALGAPTAQAEDSSSESKSIAADISKILDDLDSDSTDESKSEAIVEAYETPCESIVDIETQRICWEIQRKYLRYFEWGYEQRKDVILFQNFSTKVILIVVISLVLLGMYFAWYQFQIAMKAMKQRVDAGESIEGTGEKEELKISGSEIVARSSYLGVVILVVSLAFFYLYLVFVYPIEEIL